ncbi:MAG: hypothetical protein E6R04_09320 [Spirochaetes bacterium]|nr:MAG: hypothetical protein E6R04_09320 [Spirochaetota bacterium]
MSQKPRADVKKRSSQSARSVLEPADSVLSMSLVVMTLRESHPSATRFEMKKPSKASIRAAESITRVPLDRKELYSSINKLKLRKRVRMVLIEIAVAIEEAWVDQVTGLVERNNLLKKQLRKRSVRPKK